MNRNWLLLGSILAGIFAYDYLVIRPFNAKHRVVPAVSTETAKTNLDSALPAAQPVPVGKPVAPTAQGLVATLWKKWDLADRRSVEIYSDGSIRSFVLGDFRPHGKKEGSISLLSSPLVWTSSNTLVQKCLASMTPDLAAKNPTLSAKTLEGFCALSFSQPMSDHSILWADLALMGFDGAQGWVQLSSVGDIGENLLAQDQWTVGWRSNEKAHFKKGPKDLIEKVELDPAKTQGVDWLVWGDRYFSLALVPQGTFRPNVVLVGDIAARKTTFGISYPIRQSAAGPSSYNLKIYGGPRESSALLIASDSLDQAVEFGWFPSVSKAMLWLLKGLNAAFHNFGVSIIVLTLLVRAAFWPLNKKVFSSGQKMKALQPEMDRLKEKYKDNMEQMNKAIFALYKQHGVNPMGSCLPLLAQMPIFIGLYGALNHSIDLYQAPFFGWIIDLSSRDPFFVLPVLWTASLVLTSFLNPTPTQPGQPDMKWILMGMNILFGFISKDWPAGLTLYLLVSNLVGILQQLMMRREWKIQPVQEGA